MMMYVSLEQELAVKDLFTNKGWGFKKPGKAREMICVFIFIPGPHSLTSQPLSISGFKPQNIILMYAYPMSKTK